MTTLTGALVAVWIAVCILTGVFLSTASLGSLCCIFSPPENTSRSEAFGGFIFCSIIAVLCFTHVWWLMTKDKQTPELPATRDIHLTVPEKVEVHTEFRLDNTVIGKEVL